MVFSQYRCILLQSLFFSFFVFSLFLIIFILVLLIPFHYFLLFFFPLLILSLISYHFSHCLLCLFLYYYSAIHLVSLATGNCIHFFKYSSFLLLTIFPKCQETSCMWHNLAGVRPYIYPGNNSGVHSLA